MPLCKGACYAALQGGQLPLCKGPSCQARDASEAWCFRDLVRT